jgi:serine/threonine-protein kinase haspin
VSAETATPQGVVEDGDYEGPFDDSDSDCGGPGSVMKKAQEMRRDENRGARFARAAAIAKDDAAAARLKLERQNHYFAEVDGFSLASESEGTSVFLGPARGVAPELETNARRDERGGRGGGQEEEHVSVSAEKLFPSKLAEESSPSAALAPPPRAIPGTRLTLTKEWLRAIPESFSPLPIDAHSDKEDVSVDVEETFVDSSDEERDDESNAKKERNIRAVVSAARAVSLEEREKNSSESAAMSSETFEARAVANAPLAAFLADCGQTVADVVPMADALAEYLGDGATKIGEGTYGEAFKSGATVLKIVPVGGETLINGEPQMGCAQIRAEASVAKRLAGLRRSNRAESLASDRTRLENVTDGFIDTERVLVTRGPYAGRLLEEWLSYDSRKTSENENPSAFPADQLYAVFVAADGGVDLEHAEVRTYAEAKSILLQVTIALAVAEEACRFEHRDLHWGNVLVRRRGAEDAARARLNGVELEYPTRGVEVRVIDFTLSRVDGACSETSTPNEEPTPIYCDLNCDPGLFLGPEGHCQSDTYREMKKVTRGDWRKHSPRTNALWLRYLADCLLEDKNIASCTAEQTAELRAFRKRASGYASASETLWDGLFVGAFKTNYGF